MKTRRLSVVLAILFGLVVTRPATATRRYSLIWDRLRQTPLPFQAIFFDGQLASVTWFGSGSVRA